MIRQKSRFSVSGRMVNIVAMLVLVGLAISPTHAKDIPGSTQTSYGVSSSGAFQFQIPIVIPQGRNGVQPNLSLSFSSSGGNGMAGVGWGVSGLGAITRCGKTIATNGVRGGVQHNVNDRFCLNGQQLILVSGTYGADGSEYRTEIDQFARIKAHGFGSVNVNGGRAPTRWTVWIKGGSIQEYGRDPTTAYKLPGTNSIHRWNLSRVSDRNGNFYTVKYRAGEGFPSEINYTHAAGLAPKQKIIYNYETRPDVRESYVLGSKVVVDDRLSSIVVKNNNTTVREYRLGYEVFKIDYLGGGAPNQSRLESVTEYGRNSEAMPPINIQWQAQTGNFVAATAAGDKAPDSLIEYYTFRRQLGGGQTEANSVKQITRGQWVDVNNDGEVDMVLSAVMPNGSTLSRAYIKVNGAWQEQAGWRLPHPLRNYSNAITNGTTGRFASDVVNQGQFSDVNGDGLVDIVYSYDLFTDNHQNNTRETFRKTYLNTGSGWQESAAYAPKDILFDYISNGAGNHVHVQTVRGSLLDVNGDGLVDWVTAYYDYIGNGQGAEHTRTWLNNGTTWVRNTAYDMPDVFTQYRAIYSLNHGQFVDVNGDGLVDWVQSYHASLESPKKKTWLNTGTGWDNNTPAIYTAPDIIFSNTNGWNDIAPLTRGRFVDVNGDGRADWVRSYETVGGATSAATFLSTGRGWVHAPGYKTPFHYSNNRYSDFERGWPLAIRGQHIDFNRDGLVDYVESYKSSATGFPVSKKAWLNTGSSWFELPAQSVHTPTDLFFDYSGRENAKPQFGQYLDINSDGAADWVRIRKGTALSAKLKATPRVNLVKSITTTMGIEVEPEFLPLTDNGQLYKQHPSINLDPNPPTSSSFFVRGASYVTASVTTPTPDPAVDSVTTYQYEGAKVDRLRGFLGFHRFTSTSSLTDISSTSTFSQTFPYIGLTLSSSTRLNGDLLATSSSTFDSTATSRTEGINTYFRFANTSTSDQFELATNSGGAKYRRTEVDGIQYDSYGNLETQRTRVIDNADNILHTTLLDNDYVAPNLTHWLVGLVSKTTQVNQSTGLPAVANTSRFTYYPNNRGQLRQVLREPDQSDNSVKLTTSYTYDNFGNVETETTQAADDPQTPTDRIGYDLNKRLATTLTNALGKVSIISYHLQCDQPATVTDPNGQAVIYTYDNFCRQTTVTSPDSVQTITSYDLVNESCPENDCQRDVRFKVTSDTPATGEPTVTQHFSAFNQTLLTTTAGFNDEPIRQQVIYDARGRTVRSSQPYFAGDDKHFTDIEYDVLNRQMKTLLPYNDESNLRAEQNYSYRVVGGLLERTVTDPKGRTTKARSNALGQVTQVIDAHNKVLRYNYDSQGNLAKTTDALGNTIELGYDLLGRRTTLNDPDLGLSSYDYNGFSELTSQTDAKNQTISMEYDLLGRLEKRTVPGDVSLGGGISIWEYDQAPRAGGTWFGAVSRVEGLRNTLGDPAQYVRTFSYDNLGRAASESTTIEGQQFNESYQYDAAGRLSERYYPNSSSDQSNAATAFGVKYEYSNGYLSSILSTENAQGQCVEHWRAQNYDAQGRVKLETAGKVVATMRHFKPGQNVLERISSATMVGDSQLVQELNYSYDSVNNLNTRSDLTNNITESFTYDNLDRLLTHNRNGSLVTEVRYNEIGNITYKSDVGSYNYSPSGPNSTRPHAVKGISGSVAQGTDLTKFNVNWEYNGEEFVRSLPDARTALRDDLGQPAPFEYDANGNATKSGNRSIAWTAFDKPQRMSANLDTDGTSKVSVYQYGPEQQRIIKKEATVNALSSPIDLGNTTIYIGKYYERITDGDGNTTHRYMIETGGTTVQIERLEGSAKDEPKYLLTDNLGSTHVILDKFGEIEQTLAFDPWGMRMNVGDSSAVNSVTNRGYTGHETDDEVGLINMNARVYDPYLGRFLSADPVLPDAGDMQAFNRYSYVLNNPLKYVDPTGNCAAPSSDPNHPCFSAPPPDTSGGGFTVCGGISGGGISGSVCNAPGTGAGNFSSLPFGGSFLALAFNLFNDFVNEFGDPIGFFQAAYPGISESQASSLLDQNGITGLLIIGPLQFSNVINDISQRRRENSANADGGDMPVVEVAPVGDTEKSSRRTRFIRSFSTSGPGNGGIPAISDLCGGNLSCTQDRTGEGLNDIFQGSRSFFIDVNRALNHAEALSGERGEVNRLYSEKAEGLVSRAFELYLSGAELTPDDRVRLSINGATTYRALVNDILIDRAGRDLGFIAARQATSGLINFYLTRHGGLFEGAAPASVLFVSSFGLASYGAALNLFDRGVRDAAEIVSGAILGRP